MKNLFLILTVFTVCSASAQQIKGTITDEQKRAMQGVTVALKKSTDSSVIKYNVTNNSGQYSFSGMAAGNFFITATYVGYQSANSAVIAFAQNEISQVAEILLLKKSAGLSEVRVISQKPMIEVKADKTILNVEGSVNAVGQDALELLRKAPGVMVDRDDNLSLSGKNGVQVYIDGKPTPLSGTDLSAYLKGLQSSSIESIEIITNPSAKYEAAGNAGIINIRLKKNKSVGINGSVNSGFSIGTYPKYNEGFSFNYRNKNVNIYTNYNYNNNKSESYMHFDRTTGDTLFKLNSLFTNKSQNHSFKTGLDYFIDKKSTIGLMITGNLNEGRMGNYSSTLIIYSPNGQLVKTLVADNKSERDQKNGNFNLNYRYIDTSGHELNMDADAGIYRINNDQLQPNQYYDKFGNPTFSNNYNFLTESEINIYSFKTDYEQNFLKGKLGLGGKTGFVNTKNDLDRYNLYPAGKLFDSARSNAFNYKENINAVYTTYSRALKGINFQLGIRVENTNLEGISDGFKWSSSSNQFIPYKDNFKRSYTDLFPSAGITFNKNPKSQWGLRYSRRIDRPAYQDLNPFEFKLDEYSYQKGNTDLRPQYTNSFAVTHTYMYRLNTTLNYSHVTDVFTQLMDTTETSKSFLTKKNLATQDVVSINISYPFNYKWYSVFANVNANYSHYRADFGVGRTVDVDAYNVSIYQQHTFKLGKGYTAELSGFYSSPGIWQGTFKTTSMWGVDAGLMKSILKDKGTIKASVSDVFHTMQWGATSKFAGQTMSGGGGWESRLFKLNFSYRFGSNKVKAARQRKTSIEDENQRAQGQDGGLGR
ncbi:outer membrane beta-barrel family protein [soil metagenome]